MIHAFNRMAKADCDILKTTSTTHMKSDKLHLGDDEVKARYDQQKQSGWKSALALGTRKDDARLESTNALREKINT